MDLHSTLYYTYFSSVLTLLVQHQELHLPCKLGDSIV